MKSGDRIQKAEVVNKSLNKKRREELAEEDYSTDGGGRYLKFLDGGQTTVDGGKSHSREGRRLSLECGNPDALYEIRRRRMFQADCASREAD